MVDFAGDSQGGPLWKGLSIPERINPIDAAEDREYESRYGRNWLREDNGKEFGEWLAPKGINIEYVEPADSVSLMIPVNGKFDQRGAGNSGTTMAYAFGQMNMRDIGKFSSKEGSYKLFMRAFMKSDLGGEISRIFAEKGCDFENIDYVMVSKAPDSGIMGVGRMPSGLSEKFGPEAKQYEGKIVIVANYDFYQMLESIGKHYSADNMDMVFESLAEEFSHIYRKSFDKRPVVNRLSKRVEEERATKNHVVDALEKLAEDSRVPSEKMRYQKVLAAKRDDVATVKRYYKVYKTRKPVMNTESLDDILDEDRSFDDFDDFYAERHSDRSESSADGEYALFQDKGEYELKGNYMESELGEGDSSGGEGGVDDGGFSGSEGDSGGERYSGGESSGRGSASGGDGSSGGDGGGE
ncbi:hypothetical protein HYU14_00960 [Candidatus Woesearchaeota archaeon]|nr:hypothetical protein [Candidatus Woesearchaeota archaeon]